jgi:calcineurin-like phosphoesterase family protein
MRIVLLGDLHEYTLTVPPWELLGKPLFGQLNLWLNRRKKFDRALAAPTVGRAVACKPDLTLFSGDFTTTSRPREFVVIAEVLAPLLNAAPAVIIPGNHDRYTHTSLRVRRMERFFPEAIPRTFPHVRPLIGGWRLLAVDAAVPRMLDSRGRIGDAQLQQARAMLASVREDEGVIVLCHYPFGKPSPLRPMKQGHRLLDEDAWRNAIACCRGRVVIVHGHVHCPWLWRPELAGESGDVNSGDARCRVLDINAGSPTMAGGAWPRGQGFWAIDLPADPSQSIGLTHQVMGAGAAPLGMEAPRRVESQPANDNTPQWIARSISVTL